MDKKTYARMILADRQASTSFWHAFGISIGGSFFPVIILVSLLMGIVWIWTGMFPAFGGFLIGAALGCSLLLISQVRAHLRQRPWVDEFVDWKKVEEVANLP